MTYVLLTTYVLAVVFEVFGIKLTVTTYIIGALGNIVSLFVR